MSNPSSNPASSQTPHQEKASDTARNALEATGSNPVSESGTVASNHPNAPHPIVAGELPRIAGYAIARKLGEGGMGAVYLAEDERLGRKVAIKTMKREFAANKLDRERFLREARTAAAIEHDNIVPIWGLGEAADGTPFIAMPFLQGEMLDARLKRESVAPVDLILKVAGEVAEGLAAAHAKGLIHRDIKPGNIWLEGDSDSVRRCKILDFGLARSVDKEDVQLTASGAILGTPTYMAPEQARGEKVDARADLFSLGVTLYRMATGRLPFDGPTTMAVLIALTTEMPPPVGQLAPGLQPELAALIDRLMSKDREARPQSAAEVAKIAHAVAVALHACGITPTVPTRVTPLVAITQSDVPPLVEPGEPISSSSPQLLTEEVEGPSAVGEAESTHAGFRDRARRKPPVLLTCLIAALAIGALGLWLSGVVGTKKPAQDVAQNENPPKKDDPNAEPAKPDPNREAALYVLKLGGSVNISDVEEIDTAEKLPNTPFQIMRVVLMNKPQVRAADLAVFKNCEHLAYLGLLDTPVGDDGLAYFAGCKGLKFAYLGGTGISSAGVAHLKDCTQLLELNLSNTNVNDTAVVHIKRFTNLESLILDRTKVSKEGLTELATALPNCRIVWDGGVFKLATDADRKAALALLTLPNAEGIVGINEEGAPVGSVKEIKKAKDLPNRPFRLMTVSVLSTTDKNFKLLSAQNADLVVFKDCTNVKSLQLAGYGISNEGLAHFSNCKELKVLYLSGTKVGDGAAATIKQFTQLEDLILGAADFTEKGVMEAAAALPRCRIQFGYTIEPATEEERKAAEYVLSIGGGVRVNYGKGDIKDKKGLPERLFRLTGCNLAFTKATDEGLVNFKECKSLTLLDLSGTHVGDAGLANFKDCNKFTTLVLSGTQVTDAGLTHFKDCARLTRLSLANTQVSNERLQQIKQFTELKELDLMKTKVTPKGVADLAKALPKCKIVWDGDTIEPKEK